MFTSDNVTESNRQLEDSVLSDDGDGNGARHAITRINREIEEEQSFAHPVKNNPSQTPVKNMNYLKVDANFHSEA